jgi:hypothetical protein
VDPALERQLDLLRRMSALDPPVWIMGGYAEDALVAGTVTRPHDDVDWVYPRSEHDLRLAQARALGFVSLEVWGESAPGAPFYLSGDDGDLRLELGVLDEEDGALWLRVHSLAFQIDGEPPRAGYRLRLPEDTFEYPVASIDGIPVRPVSPMCLYQMRLGIAGQGSVGELTEKQVASMRRLKERFFPDRTDDELAPRVEPLR